MAYSEVEFHSELKNSRSAYAAVLAVVLAEVAPQTCVRK